VTTTEEEENYLTAEEISILFLCKYDEIKTPRIRITEGFGTLSTMIIS
jgi:hypothetical protein